MRHRQHQLEALNQNWRDWGLPVNPLSTQVPPPESEPAALDLCDWQTMAWPERLSLILSEGPGGSPRNESLARLSSDEQLALIRNMAAQSRPESNPDRAHDVRSPLTDLMDSLGLNSSVSQDMDCPSLDRTVTAPDNPTQPNSEKESDPDLPSMTMDDVNEDDLIQEALARSLNPDEQVSQQIRDTWLALEISKNSIDPDSLVDQAKFQQEIDQALALSRKTMRSKVASFADVAARIPSRIHRPMGSLRPIVVDGNNVAFHHGNHQRFSALGLKIVYEYFLQRGHEEIVIFATRHRTTLPEEVEILEYLEGINVLQWVPGKKNTKHYDDLFVMEYANSTGGVIVSNDQFRDVYNSNPKYRNQIDYRTLGYSIVNDRFLPPMDPRGRGSRVSLDTYLKF